MVGEAASGRACGTRPSVEEGRRRGHDGTPAMREREGKERRERETGFHSYSWTARSGERKAVATGGGGGGGGENLT